MPYVLYFAKWAARPWFQVLVVEEVPSMEVVPCALDWNPTVVDSPACACHVAPAELVCRESHEVIRGPMLVQHGDELHVSLRPVLFRSDDVL